jgi:SAM-dependent methyltransferase
VSRRPERRRSETGRGFGHPLFAAAYDLCAGPVETGPVGAARRALLAWVEGDVLEIGAGTGANFGLFRERARTAPLRLEAAEPDPHMRRRAERRARRLGLAVTLRDWPAEALSCPDQAFDWVVSTLVLCTVQDVPQALAEVARVLRPGGEFLFLEHARAAGSRGAWQDRLRPLWAFVGGGCQLNRDPLGSLATGGWDVVEVHEEPLPFPVLRLVWGRARPGRALRGAASLHLSRGTAAGSRQV